MNKQSPINFMSAMKKFSIVIIGSAIVLLRTESDAQAISLTFFGEDLSSGNESQPLTSTPNADKARDNFLSYLVGVGTEDFESLSPDTGAPLTLSFGANNTATLTGGGNVRSQPTGTFNGLYPISGEQYWRWTFADNLTNFFSIEFEQAQTGFGFYGTDLGDSNGGSRFSLTFDLLNGGSKTIDIPHTLPSPGGSAVYFGLIDTENPFTKVTFNSNRNIRADGFGLDNLTIARPEQVKTSVPESSSVLALSIVAAISVWLKLLKGGREQGFKSPTIIFNLVARLGGGLKPPPYCSLLPSASCHLPSSRFGGRCYPTKVSL